MAKWVSVEEVGDGAKHFDAKLGELARRIEDMPAVAAAVFEGLEKYHEAKWGDGVVDTQETDLRWPEHGLLVSDPATGHSGDLKASLTKENGPGAVRTITPWGFRYGTSLPYARFLQHGTKKMQRKHVLRVDRAMRVIIAKLIRDFVTRGF